MSILVNVFCVTAEGVWDKGGETMGYATTVLSVFLMFFLNSNSHGQVQKQIILTRNIDNNQLGIVVAGGLGSAHGDIPIFVKAICSEGSAAENGQLRCGDQILSVNGAILEGLTLQQVSILGENRF